MVLPAPGPIGVLVPQWTLIIIAAGVIIARIYLRLQIMRQPLLSTDLLMCAAWSAAVATASFDLKFASMGALAPEVMTTLEGYHGSDERTELLAKLFWFSAIPFFTAFYFCKMSLAVVYLKLFPVFMVKRRIFLWFTVAFVNVAYVVCLLMIFIPCLPIERNWSLDPKIKCSADTVAIIFAVTWTIHFVGDLLLFILPWLILPGLQLKRNLKISVYLTFALGVVNLIFCLVRAITMQTSQVDNRLPISLVELWSTLDCNISLVIACLPSLGPYFQGRHKSSAYPASNYAKFSNPKSGEEGLSKMGGSFGFKAGTRSTVSGKQNSSSRVSVHRIDDDHWNHGKKANGSDIELVEQ